MYDSSSAGGFSQPPPDTPAGGSRYVYLLGRLRNKQITMEEATELFSVQQGMIRIAARPTAPPPSASGGGPTGTPSAPSALGISVMSDEGLALALLAFGTGAGVLAAILKRNRDGPAAAPPLR
ncbi:MAG: hypothetical protein L3J91_00955 [Thermoplasmata archaeon]|nr:hypothetical protein [Thermoplasmata archaeon]